jgi:branched-chain amino acid transport system permease protein
MMGMGLSIQIIIGPILGGLGTVFGPLIGALVVVPLGEISGALGQTLGVSGMNSIGYGLALILLIGLLPGGLWPAIVAGARSLRGRK